jgi:prepilin-type N-terminal cleavage/methylation domain-containing protein
MLNRIKKQQQKSDSGFTIIEVMIVLAIAGLILLIVFLAVPALQRNSRNTSRKNDVASVLGAASEFLSNNNGVLPSTANPANTNAAGVFTFTPPASGAAAQAKVGYYTTGVAAAKGNIFMAANGTAVPAGTFTDIAHDYIEVLPGDTCNNTAAVAGSTRSIAAVYAIETGNNTYSQVCQGS